VRAELAACGLGLPAPTPAQAIALEDDLAWFAAHAPLGCVVEARDVAEDWCAAVLVAEARDAGVARRFVRAHYAGWDSTADDWISTAEVPVRVVPAGTHLAYRLRQAKD
jgi:hypothetical protein